ncbi:hypothetical protein ABKN59_011174 [Abortiporus biennis]
MDVLSSHNSEDEELIKDTVGTHFEATSRMVWLSNLKRMGQEKGDASIQNVPPKFESVTLIPKLAFTQTSASNIPWS